ncbi:MAG: hypothetical protein QOE65_1874 [Solirubrobacteraceae bacterium]|jgi:hypothetical protein|nr:hypothetical protein [Solirubrobacteraceae bacterium]
MSATPVLPRRLTTVLAAALAAVILLVSAYAADDAQAGVSQRVSYVKSGEYRTLATLWNTSVTAEFLCPAGAKVRVRYGGGWFAVNRQTQTLNCSTPKRLSVGKFSAVVARIQMKVAESGNVNWGYITEGPS